MTNISSYTKYLPPVLWSQENDPSLFLGRMLRIFEKILTGISEESQGIGAAATIINATGDRIEVTAAEDASKFYIGDILTIEGTTERVRVSGVRGTEIFLATSLRGAYTEGAVRLTDEGPLEKTIDKLPELFNPWWTPPEFLPWLASWVALPLEETWSEYQKRKFISEIVSIYQQRGLKQGLLTYLDIYAATEARPRIAIDDGEAVWRATFTPAGTAQLHAVAYSHAVSFHNSDGELTASAAPLLHPSVIAVDRENNYIVADEGSEFSQFEEQWPPALWKISSTGEVNYDSIDSPLPLPQPIYSGNVLQNPTAVAVDEQNRYYVLTIGELQDRDRSAIYRFAPPDYTISSVIDQTTTPSLSARHPVDMVLDSDSGRFYVLDRGSHFPRANPKIVVVSEGPPLTLEKHPLTTVVEPTALVMDASGRLIIADAKEPSQGNDPANPADLIVIDPAANWSETSLLETLGLEQNPLIAPTGLVFETPQSLLVCDTGVRGRSFQDRSNRHMAEPAAIYRVDLSQTPPTITRITDDRSLVDPTKMAIDRKGHVVITDRGAAYDISGREREWRARANEFGVVVLFSQQRPTSNQERNQMRSQIAEIVNQQKPGHTSWFMKSL